MGAKHRQDGSRKDHPPVQPRTRVSEAPEGIGGTYQIGAYRSVKNSMKTVSAHVGLGPLLTRETVQGLLHGSV